MSIVEFKQVTKRFGDNIVLDDISLTIDKGEVVVVVGPSGSGKSTFLRCINKLEDIQAGDIVVNGLSVNGMPAQVRELRREAGMVFQQFNLFPHMTALQNVMEAQVQVLRRSKAEAAERGRALLAKVGLADKAEEYPARLSGGQQQRVAIARALAMDPEVMLFDEVTSALDPELVGEVLRVMRALRDEGMTMVIVTHELGFAYHVADQVIFLSQGAVYEQGTPTEVLTRPQREKTMQFLDGHNQFRLP